CSLPVRCHALCLLRQSEKSLCVLYALKCRDRLLKLIVVIEILPLGRGIAERHRRDALPDDAVELGSGALRKQRRIDRDTLLLQLREEGVPHLRRHREVGLHLALHLGGVILHRLREYLGLGCEALEQVLLRRAQRVRLDDDVRRDAATAVHYAACIALVLRTRTTHGVGLERVRHDFHELSIRQQLALLLNRPATRRIPLGSRHLERVTAIQLEETLHETLSERRGAHDQRA